MTATPIGRHQELDSPEAWKWKPRKSKPQPTTVGTRPRMVVIGGQHAPAAVAAFPSPG